MLSLLFDDQRTEEMRSVRGTKKRILSINFYREKPKAPTLLRMNEEERTK